MTEEQRKERVREILARIARDNRELLNLLALYVREVVV